MYIYINRKEAKQLFCLSFFFWCIFCFISISNSDIFIFFRSSLKLSFSISQIHLFIAVCDSGAQASSQQVRFAEVGNELRHRLNNPRMLRDTVVPHRCHGAAVKYVGAAPHDWNSAYVTNCGDIGTVTKHDLTHRLYPSSTQAAKMPLAIGPNFSSAVSTAFFTTSAVTDPCTCTMSAQNSNVPSGVSTFPCQGEGRA